MRLVRTLITWGYVLAIVATAGWAVATGHRPYAPLSLLPRPQPVTLTVVYGTEQETWLRAAVAAFAARQTSSSDARINVVLQSGDSGAAAGNILDGSLQPDVWIPSSALWITRLNTGWQQRNGRPLIPTSGADAPQPIARSPLVVVTWSDHAAILQSGGQSIWRRMHDIAASQDGWGSLGHPEWGTFKWGRTSPQTSNSGLLTSLLMAVDFHNTRSSPTAAQVNSQEFRTWLQEIEHSAMLGDNSGALMNDMVAFGPSRFDAIVTYENLALEYLPNAARRGQQLALLYPSPNVWSDHPFAMIDGTWVTTEQRAAARVFRDYLLNSEGQLQARKAGYRPIRADIPLDAPDSPFTQNAAAGVKRNIPTLIDPPATDVIDALVNTWTQVSGH